MNPERNLKDKVEFESKSEIKNTWRYENENHSKKSFFSLHFLNFTNLTPLQTSTFNKDALFNY